MIYKLVRITTVSQSLNVLLKGQLGYLNTQYEVIGISSPGEQLQKVKDREQIRVIPVRMTRKITPISDLRSLFQLFKVLKKEKPHIVHTHTPKAGLLGILAAKLAGVPIRFHTIAGLPLHESTGIKLAILKLTEKTTYKYCTMVYSNSYKMAEYLIKNSLIKKDHIQVIGNGSTNGIDLNYYDPATVSFKEASELKVSLGIEEKDFVFIFIGRMVKDKGITELILSFIELCNSVDNARLILLGNYELNLDPIEEETINYIKTNKNIIYCGYQTDIRPYLAISNALVLPSYREGFPNVVLQAGAFNLPSIVSNINGCNEIITNNFNGILVEAKNIKELTRSMTKLLHDKSLYLKLAGNCRVNIETKYDQKVLWSEISKEYNHYINLLKK